jgi:hypothetical protein
LAKTDCSNESSVKWRHIKPGYKGEEECEPRQVQNIILLSVKFKH